MNPDLRVDLSSPTPPYEQIRAQVASLIAVGVLPPGSRLPTVRSLASDLGVAAGTVGRAYKELEALGLVESRRRSGTVVAARPIDDRFGALSATDRAELLAAADNLASISAAAGLNPEFTIEVLRSRLQSD